jgi:hypothetical protein
MPNPRVIAAQQALLLRAYARLGDNCAAAEEVGIRRENHYHWLSHNPRYLESFRDVEWALRFTARKPTRPKFRVPWQRRESTVRRNALIQSLRSQLQAFGGVQ